MTTALSAMWQALAEEIGSYVSGTTTSAGATDGTTVNDTVLEDYETDDVRISGNYIRISSGTDNGNEREIPLNDSFVSSTGTITVRRAFSTQIASSVTFSIFPFKTADMTTRINNAIRDTEYLFQRIDDRNVATRANQKRYPVVSTIIGNPRQVYIERMQFGITTIEDCEAVWTELVDSNVTATLDNLDYQVGQGSLQLAVTSGVSAGDILATEVISLDASDHIGVRFAIKSTVDTDAGDLQLLLSETAQCASATETLNIPALLANQWTAVEVDYTGASSGRNVLISVGLKYTTDIGACTINLDDIQSVTTNPAAGLAEMDRWDRLMCWNYEDNGENTSYITFRDNLPKNRRLRMIGPGYIKSTDLSATTDTVAAIEPEIRHLYALVLSAFYRTRAAQANGTQREDWLNMVQEYENLAEKKGRAIRSNIPQPTQMISGWVYGNY